VPAALWDVAEMARLERMPVLCAEFRGRGRSTASVLAVGRSPMEVGGGESECWFEPMAKPNPMEEPIRTAIARAF